MQENRLIIKQEILPGVINLIFNRPEKLNALSTPMLQLFEKHLDEINLDPNVRVVVLSGAGDKAFIAGADIAEYQGERREAFAAYQFESRRIFDKLEALTKPTIAAINGYALGGGFELALCCDMIFCSNQTQLGLPEGRLGLSPGGGGTQRLTRAVGKYIASEVMLSGWRLSGERAFSLGICNICCPAEELHSHVLSHSRALLKTAPHAQTEMKNLIHHGYDAPLAVAQSLEQEVLLRLYGTPDGQEGINAFLEKREPVFKGNKNG
ncbi:TPA: enoyl-CoA hydratase/isomerase family protein [Providencia rettgeri]